MKTIEYPGEFKVDFDEAGEIITSAHYGVGSEGVKQRRGMDLALSAAEKTQIKNFVRDVVLVKIKAHEVIA